MRKTNRCLAGLQLQAQQPPLATKVDVKQDMMKTRARIDDGVTDEKTGNISSARVDDETMSHTSSGNLEFTEPSAITKCSYDALVDKGAEAPKPRHSPMEMCMLTPTAGGVLHAGSAYKTQGTIFPPYNLFFGASEKQSRRGILERQYTRHSPIATVSGTSLCWNN